MEKRLIDLTGIGDKDLVSVTGGGGKTSFIFEICHELGEECRKAIVSSTVLMRVPESAELRGSDFYAEDYVAGGKAGHVDLAALDGLRCDPGTGIILNEADGAAMKPYKFYREYEPVIPELTDIIVHVIGCEVFDRPMSDSLFHRCPDTYKGKIFDREMFTRAMEWYEENKIKKYSAKKVLLINKADDACDETVEAFGRAAADIFDVCVISSLKERHWHICRA